MRIRFIKFFFICILFSSEVFGKPIHESLTIKAGNILQWIKIDGDNDQHPVLLFLHGGPGGSVMGYANKFTSDLQKHFIVVQWDQRETGKTKSLNSSPEPLTISLIEQDAVDVINYLKNKFHQDKIYLVGHSWGGFLALEVASHHPELLAACFSASPMIHQIESEKIALDKMKELAQKESNKNALQELELIRIPFENGTQLFYQRKWIYQLINKQKESFTKSYVENWAIVWLSLYNEACAINFFEAAPEIKCPVYFLVGRKDFQTNFKLTESYFEKLKAEKKELFWFNDSAHGLNLTESQKFQQVIISTVGQLKN
ncbi:MAG TPA: alpha/beta hydrolase [Cyclobacteriaceae bacterium]|jgi:pimeloyl-ACP methyl ester carboxylesterase|nr:alpha/beta hydrolase [Cyclobacteriaceae bacterium]